MLASSLGRIGVVAPVILALLCRSLPCCYGNPLKFIQCAGGSKGQTRDDIQRAYDEAPGPPTKPNMRAQGPPSAPAAPSDSSDGELSSSS